MKNVKRILSMVLVCCLLAGLLPTTAAAAGSDWQTAYLAFIEEDTAANLPLRDDAEYQLIDIDNDGIPELWIDYGFTYAGGKICTFDGNQVNFLSTWAYGGVSYIREEGLFLTTGGHMDNYWDTVYWLENGTFQTIAEGTTNVLWENERDASISYQWNGESVSEEVYQKSLAAAFDFSNAVSIDHDDSYRYEDICKILRSHENVVQAAFQGNTYRLFDTKLSWTEAKDYCESLGGHLVTITSQEEQDFVFETFVKVYGPAMIGLSDAEEESVWKWVTGERFSYSNWDPGEPNNEGNEDYVLMKADGTWNDGHLEREKWIFICEWDGPTAGEFRFTSNTVVNCIAKNAAFDLYAGYYVENTLSGSNYQADIGDSSIIEISGSSWDNEYGQHFTLLAKKAGSTTLTVTDPVHGVVGSLDLYVVDSETVCSFDHVPTMTIESGKTTNFYNYSGMVVDNFAYREMKNAKGTPDHYSVTMTVYNTLDLYGAVTAYDAEGNIADYCVIEKFTSMDSDLIESAESLIKSTGDLFYLFGNKQYYSGESISKKTDVEIDVPVGGYLEISNQAASPVALFANITGITIDFLATTGSLASSAGKLISAKGAIVDQVLLEAFTKDYVGEETAKTIKKLAKQELKNGNWSLFNFGDGIQSLFDILTASGIHLTELIAKEITSVTGIASITESVVMDIIPTGQLIKLLYAFSDVGELIIEAANFNKSIDFPMGIYLYPASFSDVSTEAYYCDSVQWALMNDITSGTSAATFSPDISCTRAQMVTFLWRAAGEPVPENSHNPFSDVSEDAYYYDAVLWAVEQKITSGTGTATFSPNAPCTRSQAVTFLYRYADGTAADTKSKFNDVPNSAYYADAVRWAVDNGITAGTSDVTFSPSDDCTRAQIVTFLYRYAG